MASEDMKAMKKSELVLLARSENKHIKTKAKEELKRRRDEETS